jgi:hypothetical protein
MRRCQFCGTEFRPRGSETRACGAALPFPSLLLLPQLFLNLMALSQEAADLSAEPPRSLALSQEADDLAERGAA